MSTESKPVEDRWENLKGFVARWHRPLESGDGYPESEIAAEQQLGRSLPLAIREFYALVGKFSTIVDREAHLIPLSSLEVRSFWDTCEGEDEWQAESLQSEYPVCMLLYNENQYLYSWAIREADLDEVDPPICIEDADHLFGGEAFIETGVPFSTFALLMIAWETIARLPYDGRVSEERGDADAIAHRVLVPVAEGYLPLPQKARFYQGESVLVCTMDGEWFTIAGKDQAALGALLQAIEEQMHE